MPNGTMHFLSADGLFVYERSTHSRRFYTVSKSTLTFRRVLGVNDGIEHAGMQCSYCVSMSGLHTGEDRTSISFVAPEIIEL
jgi:hypothetical protein